MNNKVKTQQSYKNEVEKTKAEYVEKHSNNSHKGKEDKQRSPLPWMKPKN